MRRRQGDAARAAEMRTHLHDDLRPERGPAERAVLAEAEERGDERDDDAGLGCEFQALDVSGSRTYPTNL